MVKSTRRSRSRRRSNRRSAQSRKSAVSKRKVGDSVQSGGFGTTSQNILSITDTQKGIYATLLTSVSDSTYVNNTIQSVEAKINTHANKETIGYILAHLSRTSTVFQMTVKEMTIFNRDRIKLFKSKDDPTTKKFLDDTIYLMKEIPLNSYPDKGTHFMCSVIDNCMNNPQYMQGGRVNLSPINTQEYTIMYTYLVSTFNEPTPTLTQNPHLQNQPQQNQPQNPPQPPQNSYMLNYMTIFILCCP